MSVSKLFATAALIFTLAAPAEAQTRHERLLNSTSFALALGADLNSAEVMARLKNYSTVVIDGELASARQIAELQSSGVLVLGYLSVGTIEHYRSWYRLLRPYRLRYWGDWGEWYANVNSSSFRRQITRRIVPLILARGFDGLFLDNTDAIEEIPRQARGMYRLVSDIADLVHARGLVVMTQNGEETILPVLLKFDGWNREDVSGTYNFNSNQYQPTTEAEQNSALLTLSLFRALGLFVSSTDYFADGDLDTRASGAAAASCAIGGVPFISNIELSQIAATPRRCR